MWWKIGPLFASATPLSCQHSRCHGNPEQLVHTGCVWKAAPSAETQSLCETSKGLDTFDKVLKTFLLPKHICGSNKLLRCLREICMTTFFSDLHTDIRELLNSCDATGCFGVNKFCRQVTRIPLSRCKFTTFNWIIWLEDEQLYVLNSLHEDPEMWSRWGHGVLEKKGEEKGSRCQGQDT